jgi:acyl-ACP thioesterase
LDAIARYLQDVAADDGRDASIEGYLAWLVRKTILGVTRRPRLGERVDLVTWASGSGARWAERRTTISVAGEVLIESASLWVCVDVGTMRAIRLPQRFWDVYGEAADGRTVSTRLTHPDRPATGPGGSRPWPLRATDLDILGHVNNAVTWAAIEDELDRLGLGGGLAGADLEYREPIDRSHDLTIVSQVEGGRATIWLTGAETVLASAVVTAREPARPGGQIR